MASVRIVMPKWSGLHLSLVKNVKTQIHSKKVSYDYLVKVASRILCCVENSSELLSMAQQAAQRRVIDGYDEPVTTGIVSVTTLI